MTGATPAKPRQPWSRGFLFVMFLIPNLLCCILSSGMPPLRLYGCALFGWALFAKDVAPRIQVNPAAVGLFAATLVGTTFGVHLFAGWLRRSIRPEAPPWRVKWTLAGMALFVLAFVAGIAAVGVVHQAAWLATQPEPFLEEIGRRLRRGSYAIGNLRTIATMETIYRDGDKDQNGILDYGSLEQLGSTKLVDSILATGTKAGYLFEVAPSVVSPEERWFAIASPIDPRGGERFFFENQKGAIFYTTSGPIRVDRVTCETPPGLVPLVK